VACPECGESAILPEIPVRLASPHGTQHVAGLFTALVPGMVSVVRKGSGPTPLPGWSRPRPPNRTPPGRRR
jgi:hypothetical protein